ncbi:hypothetical protein [Brucella sp. IR073]|uniref:hypothetical protein n=1 Tax=unclassified Brucella TaxID=2632610 RepID=UPI003B9815C5
MTTPDDLVERVARMMAENDSGPEGSALFDIHWTEFGEGYKASARVAIAEIRAALDEPTEAMLAAARRINHATDAEIWRAMLAASPLGGSE